jgi:hypothetical protein
VVRGNVHRDAAFIAIDEQANHDIVQRGGFGEADHFAEFAKLSGVRYKDAFRQMFIISDSLFF